MGEVSATDVQLLDAWKAGDDTAGNRLLERHFAALYRFFALRAADQAEDLVQQTLYALVKHRDRVREGASFRSFLFTIARNELYDYIARSKRSATDGATEISQLPAVLASFSLAILEQQQQVRLLKAIRELPLEMQIALELHYWEGLSTSELAAVLDVPQGTVKSRLRRAKESLHARMLELEDQPNVETTLTSLEDWAQRLRDRVATTEED